MNAPTTCRPPATAGNFSRADNTSSATTWPTPTGSNIVAPQYPAAGWDPPRCHLLAAGRPDPHTQYARKVRAGTARSTAPPSPTRSWPARSRPRRRRAASFPMFQRLRRCHHHLDRRRRVRPGKVQYYKYAWDNLPTHASTAPSPSGPRVPSPPPAMPPAPGTSTCRASTRDDVPQRHVRFPVAVAPATQITAAPANAAACLGAPADISVGANRRKPAITAGKRSAPTSKRAASQRHDRPDAAHRRRRPRARRRLQVGRHRQPAAPSNRSRSI